MQGPHTHPYFLSAIQIMQFLWKEYYDKRLLRYWLLDFPIYRVYFKNCYDSKGTPSKECSLSSFTVAKHLVFLTPGSKKERIKDWQGFFNSRGPSQPQNLVQKLANSEAVEKVKRYNRILAYSTVSKCMLFCCANRINCTWTCYDDSN